MTAVIESSVYADWFSGLRDSTVRARIAARIERLAAGNPGDRRSVGDGVMELRFAFGPGYRVYYTHWKGISVLLLAGGDKSTQQADIVAAKRIAAAWRQA